MKTIFLQWKGQGDHEDVEDPNGLAHFPLLSAERD